MVVQRTARPGELNYAPFDRYSLVHGLVGFIAAWIGLSFWPTLGIAVAWEFAEHFLKNYFPAFFPHPTQDTLANSVGDILSTLFGWAATTAVRRQRKLTRSGAG